MAPQLVYIYERSNSNQITQRARDLQRSTIKSHASLVSHRKRKAQTPKVQQTKRFPIIRPKCHPPGSTSTPGSSSKDQCESENESSQRDLAAPISSLIIHRDSHGFKVDPFTDIPKHEASSTWSTMEFYMGMANSQNIVNDIFNVRSYSNSTFFQLLFHPVVRLTWIVSIQTAIHSLRHPNERLPSHILEKLVRGLAIHRERMRSGTVDELSLLAALLLAVTAKEHGDAPSFEVHKANLRPLLHSCEGPDSEVVKRSVLHWESYWALESGVSSMFPEAYPSHTPRCPRYPFSPEVAHMVAGLPLGFQKLAKQGKLTFDVLQAVSRVAAADDLLSSTSKGFVVQQFRRYFDGDAPPHRFNGFWDAFSGLRATTGLDGKPPLEKLVILGLILYCFNTFSLDRPRTLLYRAARNVVSRDLGRRMLCSEEERDVLVWIGMNALDGWLNSNGHLFGEGLNLLGRMRTRFSDLTARGMSECIQLFFWSASFDRRCVEYWADDP